MLTSRVPPWLILLSLLILEGMLYVASNAAAFRVLEIDGFGGSGSATLWICITWLGYLSLTATDLFSLWLLAGIPARNPVAMATKLFMVAVCLCWPLELYWVHKTVFGLSASP